MTTERIRPRKGDVPRQQRWWRRLGSRLVPLAVLAMCALFAPSGPRGLAVRRVDAAGQAVPTISIGDPTVVEGNSGVATLSYLVTLNTASAQEVRVGYGTGGGVAGGTATGGLTGFLRLSPAVLTMMPDVGPASTYPISIAVSGVTGPIEQLDVTLTGLTHTNPSDVDVLLEAPSGETMVILSDAGGATPTAKTVITLKDDAASGMPVALTSGVFVPFSGNPSDSFPAPAPPGPYAEAGPAGPGTLNDLFRAITPNGTWKVWIVDDTPGNQGSIGNITLTFGVADPTADFVARFGQLVFPPGTTTQQIVVKVNGDTNVEPNETVFVDLFAPIGAVIGDSQGVGTILNDDGGGGGTPPTAVDDSYRLSSTRANDVPASAGVLANDISNGGGPMRAVLVSNAAFGLLTLRPDGSFTYLPADSQIFDDSFTYQVVDASGVSRVATVRLTLDSRTSPPTDLRLQSVERNLFGRYRVTARFTPPSAGPPPTGFALAGGVLPGQTLAVVPTDSTYPIFTFDAPPGSFFAWMHSLNGTILSPPSNEVPLHTNTVVTPSAPVNLLGSVDGTKLALAWKNTFVGGIPTNTILDVTGSAVVSVPLGPTDTFSFAGVPPGTYNFTVRSANAGGSSQASDTVTLTFPGTCSPPQMPEDFLLYVSGLVLGAIWDLPASGPAPTGYALNVTSPVFNGTVPLRTTNVRANVVPGTYSLSVEATNSCGSSARTPDQTVVVQ